MEGIGFMYFLGSPQTDAYFNMALEEYLLTQLPQGEECFLLWQNQKAIVVGKFQNTAEEVHPDYVREQGIQVVRRLSGGGAMYQDMGNLNFTFLVNRAPETQPDFGLFIRPVLHALAQMGANAEQSGRNDILLDGKKISGNAQYHTRTRTLHHGTLLFDSDLDAVSFALRVGADKLASKAVKSVRSRVTNIAEHLPKPVQLAEFKRLLVRHMFAENSLTPYALSDAALAEITRLREEKYSSWDWNYGRSPAYNLRRERRFPFGGITALLQVEQGHIRSLSLQGDFFGNEMQTLCARLIGCAVEEQALRRALNGLCAGDYISGCDNEQIVELLRQ